MDLQFGVIIGLLSISATLVVCAILSFYSIKEESFDEAKANRRRSFREYFDRTNAEKSKQKKLKKMAKKARDRRPEQVSEPVGRREIPEVAREEPLQLIKEPSETPRKPESLKSSKLKSLPVDKDYPLAVWASAVPGHENPGKKNPEKKVKGKVPQEKKPEVAPLHPTGGAIPKNIEQRGVIVKIKSLKAEHMPSTSKKQNSGLDKQVMNVNSIISIIQKAELSRSEVQLLIDNLLNSEDETSDWFKVKKLDSGRQDNCVKLRRQLSELDLSFKNEKQITSSLQGKLKELRTEMASDKFIATTLKDTVNRTQQEKDDLLCEKNDLSYKLKTTNDEKLELQEQLNKELSKSQQQQKIYDDQHHETVLVLKDEISNIASQMETVEEENSSLKTTITYLERELKMLQTCQEKNSGLERALNVLTEKLNEKENEISSSKKEMDVISSTLKKFKNENNTLKLENEDLSDKMSASTNEMERLNQEVITLTEKLSSHENENHGKENGDDTNGFELMNYQKILEEKEVSLKQMTNQIDNNIKNLNELKQELLNAHQENDKLKSTLNLASSELNEVKGVVAKLKSQKSESENQLSGLKNHLNDRNSEITLLKEEIEKYQQKDNVNDGVSISKKFNNVENEKTSTSDSPNGFELKYDSLKLMLEEKENHLQQIRKQLDTYMKNLSEVKQELLNTNEENVNLKSLLDKANTELTELKDNVVKMKTVTSEGEDLIASLRSNLNITNDEIVLLKEEIEKYKQRNNELRNKNWKVVQALSDTEKILQMKLKAENENGNKHKNIEELKNNVNTFVRRLFPEIDIQEYKGQFDEWLLSVEEAVSSKKKKDSAEDLQTQNSQLQSLIINYKKIISDTEQMLNDLQNHIEAEESKWREKCATYQKEIDNLRAMNKTS